MKQDIVIDGDALQSLLASAAVARFKNTLEGYNSPLDAIVADAFKINSDKIRNAVYKATSEVVASEDFARQLQGALNHKLANLVINRCAGLVEKSFHELMQDMVLRNKLQSAVVEIVQNHSKLEVKG